MIWLVDAVFETSCANRSLLGYRYGICSTLPPILVYAVPQLDDCKVANFCRQREIDICRLAQASVRLRLPSCRKGCSSPATSCSSCFAFPSFAVTVYLFSTAADQPKTLILKHDEDSRLSKDLPLQEPRWRKSSCCFETGEGMALCFRLLCLYGF